MLKFITVMCLLASTVSMAERLPVDDVIDGLRGKASHLEMLKGLFQATTCTVEMPNNQVTLQAGALRDNAIVIAVTESSKGNYLAYSSAPKAHMLQNIMEWTFKHQVKRPMIVSSSLVAAPGSDKHTHLRVKVVELFLQKDILDPVTMKPTLQYEPIAFAIPLEQLKGATTKAQNLPNGGTAQVTCK